MEAFLSQRLMVTDGQLVLATPSRCSLPKHQMNRKAQLKRFFSLSVLKDQKSSEMKTLK